LTLNVTTGSKSFITGSASSMVQNRGASMGGMPSPAHSAGEYVFKGHGVAAEVGVPGTSVEPGAVQLGLIKNVRLQYGRRPWAGIRDKSGGVGLL
jgi:hypothetical protein